MFCKNCGRQLLPNEKFCADCGAPVPVQESAVQNEQPIAENQSVEQTADMNVRNEQTQPVENHQTDAYNQMPANDYSAPQYQTVNAQADIISIRTVSRADILMIITIRAFSTVCTADSKEKVKDTVYNYSVRHCGCAGRCNCGILYI